MFEAAGRARFAGKPFGRIGRGKVGPEHFDGDWLVEARVAAGEYDPHSTVGNSLAELVFADRFQRRQYTRLRCSIGRRALSGNVPISLPE